MTPLDRDWSPGDAAVTPGNNVHSETPPSPLPPRERIAAIDVLRGLALLGMVLVHVHIHTIEDLDEWVRTATWRLVEGKSHGTFALLFGAGFALQLQRATAIGAPFAATFLRRLFVLAVFGAVAHAVFGYNVLLGYAVWGTPLLLLRRTSTRWLALIAVLALLPLPLFWLLVEQQVLPGPDPGYRADVQGALAAAAQQPGWLPLLGARLQHMAWFYSQPFFWLPGTTLSLFIVGILGVRHRVFAQPLLHARWLWALAVFGLVAWLAANWLPPAFTLLGLLRDQWLTFTYVGGFLLLAGHRPAMVVALRPIGLAGRMALSNYLLHIAVIDLIFSGYGLNVQSVRPLVGLMLSLVLSSGLVAWSSVWLRRHRQGPAEWLWRWLTYGRRSTTSDIGANSPNGPQSESRESV